MKTPGLKIQIVDSKTPHLDAKIHTIITFNKNHLKIDYLRYRPVIFVDPDDSYRRYYLNFKELSRNDTAMIYKYLFNQTNFKEYIQLPSLLALNYYYAKLQIMSKKENLTFKELLREVNVLIKTNYRYYSIACAILISLFFSQIGLPAEISKANDQIYGYDLFDDIFFPLAFPFLVFETTSDILLKTKLNDPLTISRAFISFLLWKGAKKLLTFVVHRVLRDQSHRFSWIIW